MNSTDKQEAFSHDKRHSAIREMRDRAARLRMRAAKWESLANALDEIERYAKNQSKDGGEGGHYIGVGSDPEMLLWELATRPLKDEF
jgi:hypothetical protein